MYIYIYSIIYSIIIYSIINMHSELAYSSLLHNKDMSRNCNREIREHVRTTTYNICFYFGLLAYTDYLYWPSILNHAGYAYLAPMF